MPTQGTAGLAITESGVACVSLHLSCLCDHTRGCGLLAKIVLSWYLRPHYHVSHFSGLTYVHTHCVGIHVVSLFLHLEVQRLKFTEKEFYNHCHESLSRGADWGEAPKASGVHV